MASEEDSLKQQPKFSSQQFLLSHIDTILNTIKPTYENIYQLDTTTKSLSEILALLNGKSDSISFTKLETHQHAALVPKIRLYRVEPTSNGEQKTELEYIFNKDAIYKNVSDPDMLGDPFIRGFNAGIKSFTWSLAGTNPVTAQNCIEVSMELFFDSLNAFSGGSFDQMLEFWKTAPENSRAFENSPFDNYETFRTVNYWALVYHPAYKKNRDGYDSIYYRTKVVIGWNEIEESIKNQ